METRNVCYDNQTVSVDCVVFAFDGVSLKVLLVRRVRTESGESVVDYKLPGGLIAQNETLDGAVMRVMAELTGIRHLYMRQMEVFSDPSRVSGVDLEWVKSFYGVNASRVLTVAYFSLVKLTRKLVDYAARNRAEWVDVQQVRHLIMDHDLILMRAMNYLIGQLQHEPIAFELLPRRFTMRQLQNLYEAILGTEIDSRNFRKKVKTFEYIIPTEEREEGVAHKPALYYVFDRRIYSRIRGRFKMQISAW